MSKHHVYQYIVTDGTTHYIIGCINVCDPPHVEGDELQLCTSTRVKRWQIEVKPDPIVVRFVVDKHRKLQLQSYDLEEKKWIEILGKGGVKLPEPEQVLHIVTCEFAHPIAYEYFPEGVQVSLDWMRTEPCNGCERKVGSDHTLRVA